MPFRRMGRRIFLAPALCLALAAAITACSGSSSSSAPAASSAPPTTSSAAPAASSTGTASGGSAAAVAAITTNWEKFFSSSTPNSTRVQLLQNGSTYASAVQSFSSSPLASSVSAKVTSVTVTSPTEATVKYDLTAGGQTVYPGATGVAVLQDGVWKVGDSSFCGLLKEGSSVLNIPLPAACK